MVLYEERRYEISPAREEAYKQLMRNLFLPLMTKNGAKVIGLFQTEYGNRSEYICLLAWENLGQRTKAFEDLRQDDDFLKAKPTLPCNTIYVGILSPIEL